MARGLMQNAAPAALAPPQGGAPAGGAPPSGPMPNGPDGQNGQGRRATDEEKGLYREFLATVIDAVYEEQTAEAIGNIVHSTAQAPQGAATAVEPLALIVSGAVARVAYSELENGKPITREMAAAAAASMAADLGRNMAQNVGVPPLPDDQIQAVYLRSMELLADQRDQRQMVGAAANGVQEPTAAEGAPAGNNGLMMSRPPNRRARRAQAAQQRRQERGQSRA